ncbi:hypothetical protein DNK34_01775 [Pseudomonas dryadis]|uniref:Uncharacterized protein n=1 Tax=Phytopseudomonas dryadis TaxID=2487520 RepID=A0A4Q9QT64_9GAMM|nr:hypothetical protein DNK44_23835 [Pseudomonas dryadis]TBV09293.1 hypothetical protein DNK34_01775 [Pseudomonas dryadis]TBV18681.1 hypothetical protein DNK41_06515 [Pseudomonas sp. FRB 230]
MGACVVAENAGQWLFLPIKVIFQANPGIAHRLHCLPYRQLGKKKLAGILFAAVGEVGIRSAYNGFRCWV